MRKLSKKISVMLAGCLTLGMISSPMAIAETSAPEGYVKTNSGLYIKKSVSKVEGTEDQYRLTFDVSGTAPEGAVPTTEIVLVMDRSGSMADTKKEQKITKVKTAAKNFCQTILNGKGDKVKISIVSYAENATTDIESSSNLTNLESKISSLSANGGTNTEEGLKKAKEVISTKTADKKYVVLFTDGLPTFNTYYANSNYMDENGKYYKNMPNADKDSTDLLRLGNVGSKTYNNDIMAAQRAYHNIVGGIGTIGGIAPRGYYKYRQYKYSFTQNKESTTEELTSSTGDSSIKFYTMGLFTNSTYSIKEVADDIENSINASNIENIQEEAIELDESTSGEVNQEELIEDNSSAEIKQSRALYDFTELKEFDPDESTMAKEFLYSIQNVAKTEEEYIQKYYTSSTDSMTNIFNSIANEISAELTPYIGKDVVIKDTVTSDFSIVPLAQNDIKGIDDINNNVTINGNDITFSLGDVEDINSNLSKPDKTISFVIKVNDPYLFGENIPTNTIATIDHTKPISPNNRVEGEEFNIPHVTIDPKKATIKVSKIVNNENNYAVSQNEVFPILITEDASTNGNKEQYNFLLKDGQSETITVYLRGENTDINTTYANAYKNNTNYNFDKTLNFLTVGNYTVSEVVPMNYKLLSITNRNFTIDKDHKNIEILVTNECINDSYFHDSENKPNELTYKPQ